MVNSPLIRPYFLGGGGIGTRWWFQYFLLSPLFGEDLQFDEHIFQMASNHQPVFFAAKNGSTPHFFHIPPEVASQPMNIHLRTPNKRNQVHQNGGRKRLEYLLCVHYLIIYIRMYIYIQYIYRPWKLTWHWNMAIFNRRYIFNPGWTSHCHVSFHTGVYHPYGMRCIV